MPDTTPDPAHPTREALEAAHTAALQDWQAWNQRAAQSQTCDIAIAAQRARDRLTAIESLLDRNPKR